MAILGNLSKLITPGKTENNDRYTARSHADEIQFNNVIILHCIKKLL